jgi:hypothetical protein
MPAAELAELPCLRQLGERTGAVGLRPHVA